MNSWDECHFCDSRSVEEARKETGRECRRAYARESAKEAAPLPSPAENRRLSEDEVKKILEFAYEIADGVRYNSGTIEVSTRMRAYLESLGE